jgi:hypothetical protein
MGFGLSFEDLVPSQLQGIGSWWPGKLKMHQDIDPWKKGILDRASRQEVLRWEHLELRFRGTRFQQLRPTFHDGLRS